MTAKNGFLLFYEYEQHLEMLSDCEVGQLVRALFRYDRDGQVPQFSGMLAMAFSFIRADLDLNRAKYEARCANNRANALKRWHQCERNQRIATVADSASANDNDNAGDGDKDRASDDADADAEVVVRAERRSVALQLAHFSPLPQLQAALQAFAAWRQQMHKPLTPTACSLLLAELRQLAVDDQECLVLVQQALAHGWLGFYPPLAVRGKDRDKRQSRRSVVSEYDRAYQKFLNDEGMVDDGLEKNGD